MGKRNQRCIDCRASKPKRLFAYIPLATNAETKPYAKSNICQDCQRVRAAALQADPDRMRRKEMDPYRRRNYILKAMGFASYPDYLRSETWQKIRHRVLSLRNHTCESCGARATLVHHNLYNREQLTGASLKGLKALCHPCHERVEFSERGKVGLVEASHRFYGGASS